MYYFIVYSTLLLYTKTKGYEPIEFQTMAQVKDKIKAYSCEYYRKYQLVKELEKEMSSIDYKRESKYIQSLMQVWRGESNNQYSFLYNN